MGILNDIAKNQLRIHEKRLREAEQELEQNRYRVVSGNQFIKILKKDIEELKAAINDTL